VAEAARREAEAARRQAEAQRHAAEESLDAAGQKVAEAEAYLAEVKAKPGSSHGAIWWMEKELEEQKKYLPSSKGGVAKRP
jgi:multidrug resistance efflux pump